MKKYLSILLMTALLLSGCNMFEDTDPEVTTTVETQSVGEKPPAEESAPVVGEISGTDEQMFTQRDLDGQYAKDKAVLIQFDGDAVSCNSAAVKVEANTLTIGAEGYYIIRGQWNNGSIIVDADEKAKVQLVLAGVRIHSESTAALYVARGDKVFVTLTEGTENTLSNGGSLQDTIDGTVFSKPDLTFNGKGSLTVESPGGHGIVCKDDLVIAGGSYSVCAAGHGVDVNDSFRMKDGSVSVDSGKDGIHAEDNDNEETGFVYISGGSLNIEAEGDGISAAYTMQINDGTIGILAGSGYENGSSHSSDNWGDFMGGGPGKPGGSGGGPRPRTNAAETEQASTSMKGLKAKAGLLIGAGVITIDSADDGIHSSAFAVINGGTIRIASGDDGIHAQTDLTITGGSIDISTSYEGLEAQNVRVTEGVISLIAKDDGINAAGGTDSSGGGGRDQMHGGPGFMGGSSDGSIIIDGGQLYIQSSGDGMDANGYLEINGGTTVVCGPNSGDTATLDFDTTGTINGGIFIGTGSSFMAQTFSDNQQGVLAVQASQFSGVTITVTDRDGNVLLTHEPKLDFSVFIFSAPELVSGQTYQITIGDKEGSVEAY